MNMKHKIKEEVIDLSLNDKKIQENKKEIKNDNTINKPQEDLQKQQKENFNEYMNNLKKDKNYQDKFKVMDIMKIYDVQMEYFYNNSDYHSALDYTTKLFEQLKIDKIDDKETV